MAATRELPTGTVTFLFSDIEGSTRLLHELGDRYADVLAEHRRVLREAFARHGGVEVDTQGDAFFVAFERASEAVAAAAEAQRALAEGPVRVRIGIHTGEPIVAEGYVGMDVHRGARIMGAGHGGQVLLSQTTRELLDERFELRDLGEHRLKDLSAAQRLYQLGDGAFPPLKTLHQTNLPVAATPLIGRESELRELASVFSDGTRLVTVTGAGGTGKTRFALQVAADLVDDFRDGVFWVPLQAVADPALVVPTVAQTLGAKVDLTTHLRSQRALLLLDNFEHLLAAAPALADLVGRCPELRLLVTSRAPLRIAGEHEFSLAPLADGDAAALFVERARAAGGSVEADATVASICRRLDNLPLAVELAAARAKVLDPVGLLARLERALPVLTGGRRDAPERHRTLRATIEWSYDLLDPNARTLFARLAVFAGSFSLEAAEEACDGDLDSLAALVDLALVRPVGHGRFLLLDTIREYAAERLAESPEEDEVRRRHAAHYLRIAESANLAADREGPQRHDLVIPDQHNMRAAMAWALEREESSVGLTLAVALENFWATADPSEGQRWVGAFLDRDGGVPHELRARALRVCGGMSNVLAEWDRAERLFEESLREFRSIGDERGEAILLHRLATVATARGQWQRARELAEQSLAGHRRTGFRKGEPQALTTLAYVAQAYGDHEGALELFEQSAEIAEEIGFRWWFAGACADIAALLLDLGRAEDAAPWIRRALAVAQAIGDRAGAVYTVALAAEMAAAAGDTAVSGRLWGAIESEFERVPFAWLNRSLRADRVLVHADTEFEDARAEGRELSIDDAVEYALRQDDA